eukprot:CAMPEP_0194108270 /NCGR_PEP_ID=MMETSP0150-20130528/8012_1 /TAXON_ID=122233 /ORGANISM="Chaetoceros debilis, Strain MM31A-1" /LENGTH=556 /DNA_ID=CAMNT_0038796939 /DNA_START=81 /DNA_END=1748 /DNA_ORIENTATION=-
MKDPSSDDEIPDAVLQSSKSTPLGHSFSDVGSFQGRPADDASTLPSSSSASSRKDDASNLPFQDASTNGSMGVNMKFHNDPEQQANGAELTMEQNAIHLYCSIPPSKNSGSRCFASIEGDAGFLKQRGFAKNQFSLGCYISHGLSLLYNIQTADGLFHNSYGSRYDTSKSSSKIIVHHPSSTINTNERVRKMSRVVSIYNSTKLSDLISAEIEMGVSSQPLTVEHRNGKPAIIPAVASLSAFRVGLATIHDTTALPQIRLYIDLFQRLPLQLSYEQKIGQHQRKDDDSLKEDPDNQSLAEVSLGLGMDYRFEIKTLLSRTFKNLNKFSIGVGHSTWSGLSWIFRFQQGDAILNIPIQISSNIGTSSTSAASSALVYSISVVYLSFLSTLIHTIIGDIIQDKVKSSGVSTSEIQREAKMLCAAKSRIDAENQIKLMTRKAEINCKSEESKSGLVIEKATYSIKGGECLEVTTALQFWVSESRLKLASSSFGGMLGFYNLESSVNHTFEEDKASKSGLSGLTKLWDSIFDPANGKEISSQIPVLHIRYRFNEKIYDIS